MVTNKNLLRTAGLIVVKDNQLLLAYSKNKQAWYLPGGKVEEEETPIQSLIREIKEELDVQLQAADLQPYCHILAQAFGEKPDLIMEQSCFLGPALDSYKASGEIGAVRYFTFEAYMKQAWIVPGVITAFNNLFDDGLLKPVPAP